jgi:hypothetical protein
MLGYPRQVRTKNARRAGSYSALENSGNGRLARPTAGSSITGQAPAAGSTQSKDIGSGSVRDTLRAAISQHS